MHASVDNIDGFEDMEDAHQAVIHKMLKGQLEGDSTVKGAVISAVIAGSAGDGEGGKAGGKKKKLGVGATLMGNSNVDLLAQGTAPALGKKRTRTAGPAVTREGNLVDCGADSDATDEYEVGVTNQKPMCPHGANCFRKNPDHFKEYRHPGDKDVNLGENVMQPTVVKKFEKESGTTAAASSTAAVATGPFAGGAVIKAAGGGGKAACPYGAMCVLKTPAHLNQYAHGAEAISFVNAAHSTTPAAHVNNTTVGITAVSPTPKVATAGGGGGRKPCPYIPMCLRSDAKHLAEYSHE
eukprot:GILI01027257.1.p1 GENE.GILI01027257.1~~GILI01027257.1.p1  ORF type:complete len:311 (+),score=66.35 GILI01027257.1:51-935(+)